jgi:NADPH-dependent 2,4-dienoyl-CoA reductase/sulfur reductase-like enzyme
MNREAHHFEVLVIGGGPAGLAAAACAAESGARVGLVDDNPTLGGQIWRSESNEQKNIDASKWIQRVREADVSELCGVRVVHQPESGVLLAERLNSLCELRYDKLVLATGARERFLPFPGWTLPNVMGAGGLQAMVKGGLPIRSKRVIVAGTGPLLLAVAAYLRKHGAEIALICEQASWGSLAAFGLALSRWPAKVVQGLLLQWNLLGVPFAASAWVVGASGHPTLECADVFRAGRVETIPCDYLACGFHLVPNVELPLLLGCAVDKGCVRVDELQKTSVASVYCAGEPTSVGGVELAILEGQIAGLAASGHETEARAWFGGRQSARRFAQLLDSTFHLRSELRNLPLPETTVCRCEDVTYSRLQQHSSWRGAKLHTRCGMGPCQGRVCGPATEFLFKWNADSIRPPVFPARVETLAAVAEQLQLQAGEAMGGH